MNESLDKRDGSGKSEFGGNFEINECMTKWILLVVKINSHLRSNSSKIIY